MRRSVYISSSLRSAYKAMTTKSMAAAPMEPKATLERDPEPVKGAAVVVAAAVPLETPTEASVVAAG